MFKLVVVKPTADLLFKLNADPEMIPAVILLVVVLPAVVTASKVGVAPAGACEADTACDAVIAYELDINGSYINPLTSLYLGILSEVSLK